MRRYDSGTSNSVLRRSGGSGAMPGALRPSQRLVHAAPTTQRRRRRLDDPRAQHRPLAARPGLGGNHRGITRPRGLTGSSVWPGRLVRRRHVGTVEVFVNAGYGYDVRCEVVGSIGAAPPSPTGSVDVRRSGDRQSSGSATTSSPTSQHAYRVSPRGSEPVAARVPSVSASPDGYVALVARSGGRRVPGQCRSRTGSTPAARPPFYDDDKEADHHGLDTGPTSPSIRAGRIGASHARLLAGRVSEAELVAVADPQPGAAEAVAAPLGARSSFLVDQVLTSPDVDAVVIVAATPWHTGSTAAAAEAGKHVFGQKTVCMQPRGD